MTPDEKAGVILGIALGLLFLLVLAAGAGMIEVPLP